MTDGVQPGTGTRPQHSANTGTEARHQATAQSKYRQVSLRFLESPDLTTAEKVSYHTGKREKLV